MAVEKPFEQFEINKIKIAVWPLKKVRSVWVEVQVKAGSWYEQKDQLGIFHFLEHLSVKETGKWPSLEKLDNYLDKYALYCGAKSSGPRLVYNFKFPDIYFNKGLQLLNQVLFKPLFLEKRIDRELPVIEQEHREYWDNPYNRFFNQQLNQLFGKDHVYCQQPLGNPEQLKHFNQPDFVNLHQKHFQPQNMVVSIVGNVDAAEVKQDLKKVFSKRKNQHEMKLKPEPVNEGRKKIVHQDVVRHPMLVVSWFIPCGLKMNLKNYLTVGMVQSVLAGWSSSLLFKRLRNELGLVYGINCKIRDYPTLSLFEISCRTSQEKADQVIEEIKHVIENYLNHGISKEKFNQIRKVKDLVTAMHYDHGDNICRRLASQLFNNKPLKVPEDYAQAIADLTEKQTRLFLKDYLSWDKAYISLMTKK